MPASPAVADIDLVAPPPLNVAVVAVPYTVVATPLSSPMPLGQDITDTSGSCGDDDDDKQGIHNRAKDNYKITVVPGGGLVPGNHNAYTALLSFNEAFGCSFDKYNVSGASGFGAAARLIISRACSNNYNHSCNSNSAQRSLIQFLAMLRSHAYSSFGAAACNAKAHMKPCTYYQSEGTPNGLCKSLRLRGGDVGVASRM